MIKIQIKTWYGSLLFEYEKENNTVKETLLAAITAKANLGGANLRDANLGDANLGDADLGGFKHDIWAILLHAPHEIQGLVDSINAGKINGSVYEGECACLLGTIANVKGVRHTEIPGLVPDSRRPAEIWFLQFKKGQTPENYSPLKLTLDWIEEFRKLLSLAK